MRKLLILFIFIVMPFAAFSETIDSDNLHQNDVRQAFEDVKIKAKEYYGIAQVKTREYKVLADEYIAKGKALIDEYFGPDTKRQIDNAVSDMGKASDKVKEEIKEMKK